jgi:hypothetical protein
MPADVARMCKGRTHGGRPLAAAGQGWGVALCLYMCVHTQCLSAYSYSYSYSVWHVKAVQPARESEAHAYNT